MKTLAKVVGKRPGTRTRTRTRMAPGVASALGIWLLSGATASSQFVGPAPPPGPPPADNPPPGVKTLFLKKKDLPKGTLGYGPPGLHPGYQGFGLDYHKGYGYGGPALGTGAEGGFPFYGGPGYPHPEPTLRRFGPIVPFSFYGGPGGPTAECPHYFGTVGPLVVDPQVIEVIPEPDQYPYQGNADQDFGCYTGALGYPESAFAPFTTRAGTVGPIGGPGSGSEPPPVTAPPSTTGAAPAVPAPIRSLAIAGEAVAEPDGTRGVRITQVAPGSVGASAGLKAGDVIRAINGYATEKFEDIGWIIANAARDGVLGITVRGPDGQLRTLRAVLP